MSEKIYPKIGDSRLKQIVKSTILYLTLFGIMQLHIPFTDPTDIFVILIPFGIGCWASHSMGIPFWTDEYGDAFDIGMVAVMSSVVAFICFRVYLSLTDTVWIIAGS